MNNNEKILKKIFEDPEYRFHIRELAKLIKLNPNTIIKITNELEKKKIIKKERRKNLMEVYADLESKEYKKKKKLFNLSSIYDSGIMEHLVDFYNPKSIVLFGSYLRGEDLKRNDIDIAVISKSKKRPNLDKFEKLLKRNIHLLVFDYKEISKEFFNSLINGYVLYGHLSK